MSKILYLECPTGIAGDMCLGALVDLGVPLDYLVEQLGRLGIAQEYHLWTESVLRNGQRATKFHVGLVSPSGKTSNPDAFTTFDHSAHQFAYPASTHSASTIASHSHHSHDHAHNHAHDPAHPHSREAALDPQGDRSQPASHTAIPIRHLPEIEQLIRQAKLPVRAEAWSLAVFRKLAEAEAAVHGVPLDQVHFHEVGATDALVDIIGTCLGLDWLGIDRVYCSALPTGGGTIRAAHGRLPIPAPAVLKLFEMGQVQIYSNGIDREMVTPTGAAIAITLAAQFGNPPKMVLRKVGLGAGSQDLAIPNILRLWLGEVEEGRREKGKAKEEREGRKDGEGKGDGEAELGSELLKTEAIAVLETQIDDLSPQAIGYVLEALLQAGALDVFTQGIGMKKSRPGILLTVICRPEIVPACEALIFRETTTLGIRRSQQQRQVLPREIQSVQTPYGPVKVKVAWAKGQNHAPTNIQPEYEDCAQIARQQNIPWRRVHQAAVQGWQQQFSEGSRI